MGTATWPLTRMRNSRKSDRCLDTDPTCATPKYVRIGTSFNGRVWALRAHRSPSKGVPLAVCLASLPRPGPAHRDLDVGGSWLRTTRAGEDRSPYGRVLHSGRCAALSSSGADRGSAHRLKTGFATVSACRPAGCRAV